MAGGPPWTLRTEGPYPAQRVSTALAEHPLCTRHCSRGYNGEQDRQTDRQTGRRRPELRCQWGSSSLRVQVGKWRAEGHRGTGQHLNRGTWLGERGRAGFQRKRHPSWEPTGCTGYGQQRSGRWDGAGELSRREEEAPRPPLRVSEGHTHAPTLRLRILTLPGASLPAG